jgi:hypothetical protein
LRTRSILAACLLASGCGALRPVGRNVMGGALDELEARGGPGALTRSAVVGARDELTSAESSEKLKRLQMDMMQQMTVDAARLRQELLGEAFRADIERARAELLERTRADLGATRDDLLGARTRDAAGAITDRLVGEITRAQLAVLRDELLGERSRLMAQQLVQQTGTAAQRELDTLRVRLEGEKQQLKDELQRTLWVSGTTLAGLTIAIVVLVFGRRRYERMIEAITGSIRQIPDASEKEDLARRIARRAKELGVGAVLRSRLAAQDLLGRDEPPASPPAA